jgi:hypothetical protein
MNWVIVAKRAVIAIVKQDKVRTFAPNVNQDKDSWKMQYRKYHTLIIPDNKTDGIYVSYTAIDAPAMTATVGASGTTGGSTKFTAALVTAVNTLGYILGAASPDAQFNDLLASFTGYVAGYTSEADIPAEVDQVLTMVEVDTLGRIVLLKEAVLEAEDIKST